MDVFEKILSEIDKAIKTIEPLMRGETRQIAENQIIGLEEAKKIIEKFKPGQWVFAIEVEDDCFEEKAEICGYLFMAECGNYVIGCSEYMNLMGDFEAQLEEMYEESLDCGLELYLLRKDLCFETEKEANEYLKKMLEE